MKRPPEGIVPPGPREEVEEELAFHLEMRARQYIEEGMDPAEARERALRRFGELGGVEDECRRLAAARHRERRRAELLSELRQDARYALRQLRASPGFAAVAVLTLALGIGATTAVFSAVEATLLRPLPYPAADRLVVPRSVDLATGDQWASTSYPDVRAWRDADVFESVGFYRVRGVNLGGGEGEPERVSAAQVSDGFFRTLSVGPTLGRLPREPEFGPGASLVGVLSHGLWRRRFGADTGVLGRELRVAGRSIRVVGVLPPDMGFPEDAELWLPLQPTPEELRDWDRADNYVFYALARLDPEKGLERARAEVADISARLRREHPTTRADVTVALEPLRAWIVGEEFSRALWLFLGAVGLVLLIGCVNVANLLLSRAAARERELAVRSALGAGRGRLARQLLTESTVLALAGGALGVVFAFVGVRVLLKAAPPDLPRLADSGVDPAVLAFALGVSVLSALLFGLVPSLRAARRPPREALGEGTLRGTGAVPARRRRNALVAAELALSVVLLVGAGLLLRSFAALSGTEPGFETGRLLAFSVALQDERYDAEGEEARAMAELLDRVRRVPGVERAGMASSLPIGAGGLYLGRAFLPEGRPEPPDGEEVRGMWSVVSPGYFRTMRIPLLAGRAFTGADEAGSEPVAIVSRAFVRELLGSAAADGSAGGEGRGDEGGPGAAAAGAPGPAAAVGMRVRSWRDENVYRRVVGVVDDVRFFGAGDELRPLFYVPHAQDDWGTMSFVVRSRGDPRALVPALRSAVSGFDPGLAVADPRPMAAVFESSVAPRRFGALLLGAFAGLALVLALVGIYGVLSYGVARRRREIGVRMAFGAGRGRVTRLVLREAGRTVAAGLTLGLVGAFGLTRLAESLLYEVRPTDPLTYAAVAALLAATALTAAWIPARRASSVDPAATLRV